MLWVRWAVRLATWPQKRRNRHSTSSLGGGLREKTRARRRSVSSDNGGASAANRVACSRRASLSRCRRTCVFVGDHSGPGSGSRWYPSMAYDRRGLSAQSRASVTAIRTGLDGAAANARITPPPPFAQARGPFRRPERAFWLLGPTCQRFVNGAQSCALVLRAQRPVFGLLTRRQWPQCFGHGRQSCAVANSELIGQWRSQVAVRKLSARPPGIHARRDNVAARVGTNDPDLSPGRRRQPLARRSTVSAMCSPCVSWRKCAASSKASDVAFGMRACH